MLKIQRENKDLATEVSRVSKIKYDQGVGSNLEVINAETSLKEAETNYYGSLYDVLISKIDYAKATGNLK
jgi:outer membrane protein TolC